MATIRGWMKLTETRTLLPIFLIAMAGPIGEALDVAMFLTLEVEVVAFDLGLEVVSSILIYGYKLMLIVLAALALARFSMVLMREGTVPVHALVSACSRRPAKIPIR
ncbi:MAG: hypothetical protein FJX54_19235 [Alphaproteobacteria bacterium]|nr:hypothetical protein [Alphaproteobacteria bacterium]